MEGKGKRRYVEKPGTAPLDTFHHGITILVARILYLDGRGRTPGGFREKGRGDVDMKGKRKMAKDEREDEGTEGKERGSCKTKGGGRRGHVDRHVTSRVPLR